MDISRWTIGRYYKEEKIKKTKVKYFIEHKRDDDIQLAKKRVAWVKGLIDCLKDGETVLYFDET